MTKICTKCDMEKEISEFYKDSRAATKTTSKCKDCIDKYQKEKASTIEYKKSQKVYMENYMKSYIPTEHTKKLQKESQKEYRKKSTQSGLRAEYHRKRRALQNSNDDGTVTMGYLTELLNIQSNRCYYCNVKLDNYKHLDHYKPISKGGVHSISNIVWSCPSCNLKKGAKMPNTYYPIFPIKIDDKNHTISSLI